MTMFTLHRSYTLRTNKGHSIRFEKGVPAWVPPLCEADAVAIGAIPDTEVNVGEVEEVPVKELTPQQREEAMFKAFAVLEARADRGDFTASNMPHCKRMQPITGFEISIAERDEAWQKYKAKKQEEANE